MKESSFFFACMIALVAIAIWAPPAEAYETYSLSESTSIAPYGNCVECHGDFRAKSSSEADQDPANWGNDLHDVHRNSMPLDCSDCHTSGSRVPVYTYSSDTAPSGTDPAISCIGCHEGAGLRVHHTNAGVGADGNGDSCLDCHDETTPPTEDVLPPWYATLNWDPCNSGGSETFAGSLGLDNDGNGLYDGADLMACLAKGDINGSGVADLADVILSLQIAEGKTPAGTVHKEADINNDQKIGIPEAVWIMSNSGL